jgi:hypothetical protein
MNRMTVAIKTKIVPLGSRFSSLFERESWSDVWPH